jgi:hypothetical protein
MHNIKANTAQFIGHRRLRAIGAIIAVLAVFSASAAADSLATPLQSFMKEIVTPTTDALWSVGAAPRSDDEWQVLEAAARRLMDEGGAMPLPHEGAEADWVDLRVAMVQAANRGYLALQRRNFPEFTEASDALYESCENCHAKYLKGAIRGL